MITTVFFDLDGTLLPMDQDAFIQAYVGGMTKYLMPYGYDPEKLPKAVWKGTGAMTVNDGTVKNETVFWRVFDAAMGMECRKDEPLFEKYYRTDFQKVKNACGFEPKAAELIQELHNKGLRTVLATNPLFPAIATQSRIRWAGLQPEDFEWITTYDNSSFCKPNPDYYREILDKLGLQPENCLMIGNDVTEDMAAAQLGMHVFLVTDCMINKHGKDIDQYPHGSFCELMTYIRGL